MVCHLNHKTKSRIPSFYDPIYVWLVKIELINYIREKEKAVECVIYKYFILVDTVNRGRNDDKNHQKTGGNTP